MDRVKGGRSITQPGSVVIMGTSTEQDLCAAAQLQKQGRHVHVIHAGAPFHAPLAGNVESLLLCYARQPATLTLAVRALFGMAQPEGVYPLKVNNEANRILV